VDDLPAEVAADPATMGGKVIQSEPCKGDQECDDGGEEIIVEHLRTGLGFNPVGGISVS
jgi:hypothetical protein